MMRLDNAITAVRWLVRNTNHNAPEFNSLFDALGKLIQAQQLRDAKRDECSHGVRRDLCPDCSPTETVNDYDEQGSEHYQGESGQPHHHTMGCYDCRTAAFHVICGKSERRKS